ncbi:MAG TPA: T9SS type A sorting domain-containing protein, partial [Ferruginibacter sp.]|nr:T9SS type A sorting domain-containing protein [Ferruginibacter sp.]
TNSDTGGGGGGGIGGTLGASPGSDGANGADAADVSGLFAALSGGTILPISWKSFTATNQNRSVLLQWQTAFEQNSVRFTVQHSTDGINFINIGAVAAAGNSSIVKNYSYLHQDPPTGTSYYRLVQSDISGRNSFSIVVKNDLNATPEKDFILVVNPVINGSIQLQLSKNAVISLLSLDGKLVYRKSLQKGPNNINVNSLAKGNYILQSGSEAQKILIQ